VGNATTAAATGALSYDHVGRLTGLSWYGAGGGSGSGSGSGSDLDYGADVLKQMRIIEQWLELPDDIKSLEDLDRQLAPPDAKGP
jgi:hypothetical protein